MLPTLRRRQLLRRILGLGAGRERVHLGAFGRILRKPRASFRSPGQRKMVQCTELSPSDRGLGCLHAAVLA